MPNKMNPRGNYIQGQFRLPEDPNGEVLSRNPGDLDIEKIPVPFSYEHVHEAVIGAKRALIPWSRMASKERVDILNRFRNQLKNRTEDIAYAISFETGKPLWEAKGEIKDTLLFIDYFLKAGSQTSVEIKTAEGVPQGTSGSVRFIPRGVMAIIFSESLPCYNPTSHFLPALLNGNTVVLKAPKWVPVTLQCLAEVAHESGIPAGAFNVLQGSGEVGRRLVAHPEIDGVFFIGAFETAAKVRKQVLSDYWKLPVLETGGKNGAVIWSDAEYEKALYETLTASFLTSGQRLTSTNKILIHQAIFDKFVSDFHELAKKCRVGFGLATENAPFMGPLIDEPAVENYLRFQGIAVREGAEEIMRGKTLERDSEGYYVSPSIHYIKRPNPKGVYETSEIFGPNVAVYQVKDIDEAAEILNISHQGLVATVYSRTRENYLRLIEQAEVGCLHWNRMTIEKVFSLPYGGLKRSGNGRPMGSFAGYQCTHPVSSIESTTPLDLNELPSEMPRL